MLNSILARLILNTREVKQSFKYPCTARVTSLMLDPMEALNEKDAVK